MRNMIALILFFTLSVATCNAQGIYSKQDLEKASQEDLNQYLRNAENKRIEGVIMAIAGPAFCVGGGFLLDNAIRKNKTESSEENDEKLKDGFILLGVGLLATIISIPTIVTGSIRINKVKKAMNSQSGAGLNISPGFVNNNMTGNLNPGLTLTLRF